MCNEPHWLRKQWWGTEGEQGFASPRRGVGVRNVEMVGRTHTMSERGGPRESGRDRQPFRGCSIAGKLFSETGGPRFLAFQDEIYVDRVNPRLPLKTFAPLTEGTMQPAHLVTHITMSVGTVAGVGTSNSTGHDSSAARDEGGFVIGSPGTRCRAPGGCVLRCFVSRFARELV